MVKVIIIGAGFGGINAAQALKKAPVDILLIDRTNYHLFQPLLYQVATAALSIDNIASPIREILRDQSNAEVIMAEVEKIDVIQQKIGVQGGGSYAYDYLIVAPGAKQSYFGHDQWETYAPGLKTIMDAVHIREQILLAFEKAEQHYQDPEQVNRYLSFAIVGAGPTGVEMAGSIAEFAHRTLFENFRHINPAKSKIYLIEGAGQVLPSYPPELAKKAYQDLKDLGVDILLNTHVTNVTAEGLYMGEKFLATPNVIWAAGNQASPLLKTLGAPLDKYGRVQVNPDLTIPGHANVFVIGDAASVLDDKGQPLPGIAPVAIQQGRYVAKVIKDRLNKKESKSFAYFDKGTIATIGRGKAVAMVRKLKFSGFIAWLIWCFIHIFYLISFRSRILVMTQWMFLYLKGRRQGRVIIHPVDQLPSDEKDK
ncbi:NAD(P)/FAD-dependent oxidoreductase [Candidatus Protochlamydia phocaeensis]|uniref:NAD(P)/FAD-dependent oxidoreductase n=1 Tax=Candidatus Protochlamydia phocaeensis TaxID=1414722 RepID=UPI0008394138|nr:NAD(P)/FAD-dependent oxidoreductase [Candidatus Protochlamydia phocaeensis]